MLLSSDLASLEGSFSKEVTLDLFLLRGSKGLLGEDAQTHGRGVFDISHIPKQLRELISLN